MARTVNEAEYNAKRSEILDLALRLVYSKGYEQMTIQDILDGLKISRGAFYHYFVSKQTLLEALVERMGLQAEQALRRIVEDPGLTALEKFRQYFAASANLKNLQKPLILGLMQMWYSDDNALIRQKLTVQSLKHTARLIEPILRQGLAEQVFTTPYPAQVAEIVAGVALSLSDTFIGLLLLPQPGPAVLQTLADTLAAYFDSIERIIGAPPGSIKIFTPDTFTGWFAAPQPDPTAPSQLNSEKETP